MLLAGTRWGDRTLYPPPRGETAIPVFLVSNGFHSGLVLPRAALAEAAGRDHRGAALAVAVRFRDYDWIEAGWGDDRFYRAVPTAASFDWRLALHALFAPGNLAVMHIVGIAGEPAAFFGDADLVRLELSVEGFGRLLGLFDASFARNPDGLLEELGPGLYGPSLFYRALGTFSFANLCNHWTARLLDAAGVPVSPLVATLPAGLLLDLRWRSGLHPAARALAAPPELPAAAGTH